MLADPGLTEYFDGVDVQRVKARQRYFIAAAIGGPEKYAGRGMREAHAHLGTTPHDFDAVVGHLAATLAGLGVPADTIATVGAALAPLKDDIAPGEPAPSAG